MQKSKLQVKIKNLKKQTKEYSSAQNSKNFEGGNAS